MRLILLLLAGTILLVLCSAASTKPVGPIRVGVFDFRPLCQTDSRNADDAIFAAILKSVATKEGWSVEYIPGTLPECLDRLEKQRLDAVVAVSYSGEMANRFDFTRETVISTWAQVYAADKPRVQSLLDLGGLDIGVVRDDPYNQEIRSIVKRLNLQCSFVEFNDPGEVMSAVKRKWVEVGVVDRLYGALHAREHGLQGTPIIFSPVELRFAVPKGKNQEIISALDYHLGMLKRDYRSFYYQMLTRILGKESQPRILRYVWWAASAAAVLVLLFGGVSLILRRQVRAKTAELRQRNEELGQEVAMRRNAEMSLTRQKLYLAALNDTTLGVISHLGLEAVLQTTVARAATLVNAKNGFLCLWDDAAGSLELKVGLGIFEARVGTHTQPGEGLMGRVWESGDPMIVDEYAAWSGRVAESWTNRFRSVVGVPLRSKSRTTGVMGFARLDEEDRFDTDEQDVLLRLAQLASIALDNARLYTEVETELAQRKIAEAERSRLATAIEQSAESLAIVDTAGLVVHINPAFERETGVSREDIIGRNYSLLTDASVGADVVARVWSALAEGKTWTGRFSAVKKNGKNYDAEATVSPVRNDAGEITNYVYLSRDVTHEVDLERKLNQAQKMEAIGTLAGGIAHDFNNILAPIIGYTEMTLADLRGNAEAHKQLGLVLQAGNRAKELVKQILTFCRPKAEERKPLRIQPIIGEVLKLLRASLPSTIEIRHDLDKDAGCILADASQIHQVLVNLCTNAYHAMREEGGILEVRLTETWVGLEDVTAQLALSPGRYVRLVVSDTGHGMDRATQERIFEPYFTTKAPGEGTGLGLSMVHGIIQSIGGRISVYSEPRKGTTFHIYLPIVTEESGDAPALVGETPVGSESILLVDDEETIVGLMKDMLPGLGYSVTGCTDGAEALRLFRASPSSFDLVITDQTMPRLTGAELSSEMISIRPDIPIILCTGFSDILTAEKARTIGIRRFVMKPMVRNEIARAIRDVLDARDDQRVGAQLT